MTATPTREFTQPIPRQNCGSASSFCRDLFDRLLAEAARLCHQTLDRVVVRSFRIAPQQRFQPTPLCHLRIGPLGQEITPRPIQVRFGDALIA